MYPENIDRGISIPTKMPTDNTMNFLSEKTKFKAC